jgi:protein-disulfide isomerase
MDIYVSTTCPMCAPVKREYASLGSPSGARLRVIDTEPGAMRDLRGLGATGVPASVIDGKLTMGATPIIAELRRRFPRR